MTTVSMANVRRNAILGAWLAIMALPLAGCGGKKEPANEATATSGEAPSAAEVAGQAAKLDRPRPGSYRQAIEIIDMEMPGLPKEAAAQMKAAMAKTRVETICITEADVDKGYQDMMKSAGKNDDCAFTKFAVSGGRLDAQMRCNTPNEGEATMTMNGTVSETGSDVTATMVASGAKTPMGNMKMTMHMASQRIGECAP